MQRIRRTRRHRRSGFTLLEILIVVGIIALLAAFVVPNFFGTQRGAEIDITRTSIGPSGNLATQLELHRLHTGTYPGELKELHEKPDDGERAAKWRGPYITDPGSLKDAWGRELRYRYPGQFNQDRYDLWSVGPDGQDGTDDDITNWTRS
jgi:general secretion pathway protein G